MVKHWLRKAAACCAALLLVCCGAPALTAHGAEGQTLDSVLRQVSQLQMLAEQYAEQNSAGSDPLVLTINYIRAQRYSDFTWDMILGAADGNFTAHVQQNAPELAGLQTMENVTVSQTGQPVDFVHLVAGIGATYKRVPVICTWGGDLVQLAESIKGSGGDEAACIQQLEPYFASENENASLLPQSDWLADLDGVNIGSGLSAGEDLSEAIQSYYQTVTAESRAYQFVLHQFGPVDTGDTETFRQLVKDTFAKDSGVQLFLMTKEYYTLDEEKNGAIVESMRQPLNAACSLMADRLAEMVGGVQVTEQAEEPTPPEATGSPAAESGDGAGSTETPEEQGGYESSLMRTLRHNPQILLWVMGLLGVAAVALVVACLKK